MLGQISSGYDGKLAKRVEDIMLKKWFRSWVQKMVEKALTQGSTSSSEGNISDDHDQAKK